MPDDNLTEESTVELSSDGITRKQQKKKNGVEPKCEDMCPSEEWAQRSADGLLHSWEHAEDGTATPDLAVKQFSRPAAGKEPDPALVRTWPALNKSMVHLRQLLHKLGTASKCVAKDGAAKRLVEAHSFLWDRYRAIRQEIRQTQLHLQGPDQLAWVISANEEIARFLILADALLAAEDKVNDEVARSHRDEAEAAGTSRAGPIMFDLEAFAAAAQAAAAEANQGGGGGVGAFQPDPYEQMLNYQELTKTLLDLSELYQHAAQIGLPRPHEGEFMAYYLIVSRGSFGQCRPSKEIVNKLLTDFKKRNLLGSPHVKWALELCNHLTTMDFPGLMKLLRKAPFMLAAAAQVYVPIVRSQALLRMLHTAAKLRDAAGRLCAELDVSHYTRLYEFDNEAQAEDFVSLHQACASDDAPSIVEGPSGGKDIRPLVNLKHLKAPGLLPRHTLPWLVDMAGGQSLAQLIVSPCPPPGGAGGSSCPRLTPAEPAAPAASGDPAPALVPAAAALPAVAAAMSGASLQQQQLSAAAATVASSGTAASPARKHNQQQQQPAVEAAMAAGCMPAAFGKVPSQQQLQQMSPPRSIGSAGNGLGHGGVHSSASEAQLASFRAAVAAGAVPAGANRDFWALAEAAPGSPSGAFMQQQHQQQHQVAVVLGGWKRQQQQPALEAAMAAGSLPAASGKVPSQQQLQQLTPPPGIDSAGSGLGHGGMSSTASEAQLASSRTAVAAAAGVNSVFGAVAGAAPGAPSGAFMQQQQQVAVVLGGWKRQQPQPAVEAAMAAGSMPAAFGKVPSQQQLQQQSPPPSLGSAGSGLAHGLGYGVSSTASEPQLASSRTAVAAAAGANSVFGALAGQAPGSPSGAFMQQQHQQQHQVAVVLGGWKRQQPQPQPAVEAAMAAGSMPAAFGKVPSLQQLQQQSPPPSLGSAGSGLAHGLGYGVSSTASEAQLASSRTAVAAAAGANGVFRALAGQAPGSPSGAFMQQQQQLAFSFGGAMQQPLQQFGWPSSNMAGPQQQQQQLTAGFAASQAGGSPQQLQQQVDWSQQQGQQQQPQLLAWPPSLQGSSPVGSAVKEGSRPRLDSPPDESEQLQAKVGGANPRARFQALRHRHQQQEGEQEQQQASSSIVAAAAAPTAAVPSAGGAMRPEGLNVCVMAALGEPGTTREVLHARAAGCAHDMLCLQLQQPLYVFIGRNELLVTDKASGWEVRQIEIYVVDATGCKLLDPLVVPLLRMLKAGECDVKKLTGSIKSASGKVRVEVYDNSCDALQSSSNHFLMRQSFRSSAQTSPDTPRVLTCKYDVLVLPDLDGQESCMVYREQPSKKQKDLARQRQDLEQLKHSNPGTFKEYVIDCSFKSLCTILQATGGCWAADLAAFAGVPVLAHGCTTLPLLRAAPSLVENLAVSINTRMLQLQVEKQQQQPGQAG